MQLDDRANLALSLIERVSIDSLAGDDFITVTPAATVAFQINGGSASSGDRLTVNGTSSGDLIGVDLDAGLVSVGASAPLMTISFAGIEDLTIDPLAGIDTIEINHLGVVSSTNSGLKTVTTSASETENVSVTATAGDDTLMVTPQTTSQVTVAANGQGPIVTANAVASFTVAGGGQSDTVIVNGTAGNDAIAADANMISVKDAASVTRQVVHYVAEALTLNGLAGTDVFTVTAGSVPIFVDGGDPIGGTGDALIVTPGATSLINTGPEDDEGSVMIAGNSLISFDHIESLSTGATSSAGATINATHGPDSITITAVDTPGLPTPGARDFTVTVNAGLELLFTDTPALSVNALGGNDEITLRTPAPNGAVWDVDVAISGGTPAASDRLVVETPGRNLAQYIPARGELKLDHNHDSTFDSTIVIGQIEELVYDGQLGDDTLIVTGATDSDVITNVVGTVADRGRFLVNSFSADRLRRSW